MNVFLLYCWSIYVYLQIFEVYANAENSTMHSMVRKLVLRKLSYQTKAHYKLGKYQDSCDEPIISYGVGIIIGV